MKRTERDIYDFVAKKLEEVNDKMSDLTTQSGVSADNQYLFTLYQTKQEAYEEVLNFIGTIRTKGE